MLNKTPGPGGMHLYVIKEVMNWIVVIMEIIFSTSVNLKVTSDSLKAAKITKFYVKGIASTYRRFNLVSVVFKLP